MKAISVKTPGELIYSTIDKPLCKEGYSLLKVERIGICGTDLHAFEGTQPYFNYPRILGHELALTVKETSAKDFSIGESVTIIPYFNCRKCISCRMGKPNCCVNIRVFGVHIDGGMCEYVLIPNEYLVHGEGLTFDELALVEPLAIGAHGVRRAAIDPGEFVLVIGAGPIGLGTIEFAKIAGAQVIVLDINEHRLNFCQEKLGITTVINGIEADVLLKISEITNGDMPTVVIDATGNLNAINKGFEYLAHGGRYVLIGLQKETISVVHPEFHKREATLMSSRNATRKDFEHVISAMKNGLVNPATYITHSVQFDEVIDQFESWLNPENHVIKAIVRF